MIRTGLTYSIFAVILAINIILVYSTITQKGVEIKNEIGGQIKKDLIIRVYSPRPHEAITSPLAITGEAKGTWFFEGSFPIKLVDDQGKIIARGIGTAQGDWMQEDFVPFQATLEFSKPHTETGILILEKDNPSGDPNRADHIQIPIRFSQK